MHINIDSTHRTPNTDETMYSSGRQGVVHLQAFGSPRIKLALKAPRLEETSVIFIFILPAPTELGVFTGRYIPGIVLFFEYAYTWHAPYSVHVDLEVLAPADFNGAIGFVQLPPEHALLQFSAR